MVLLFTDMFVYILLFLILINILLVLRNRQTREHVIKIFTSPLRVVAFFILCFFVVIGLLDSFHYKKDLEVYSILDTILYPLNEESEKTYSAPFATKLFSKEMVFNEDGAVVWQSPKLKHINSDGLVFELGKTTLYSIIFALTFTFISRFIIRKFNFYHSFIAWKTMAITFVTLFVGSMIILSLSKHYHVFGTDKVGIDVFYAAIKSIRTGLVIGTITTLVTLPFAVVLGTMAGYFRGIVDDIIQYIYTTLSSVPGVLLIAAAVLTLDVYVAKYSELFNTMSQRADIRLLTICFVLGLTSWTSLCRLLRGETLKLREQEYVMAAKTLGSSQFKIIYKHIVPNLLHIILIAIALDFSGLVLAEAVLTYVGVGVDPSTYSWGNMINAARLEMGRDPVIWWSLFGAFVLMFMLVLSANIVADAVRDAFDPKVT